VRRGCAPGAERASGAADIHPDSDRRTTDSRNVDQRCTIGYKQTDIHAGIHSFIGDDIEMRYRLHCEVDGLDIYAPFLTPAQHVATWDAINETDTEASWLGAHPVPVKGWLQGRPAVERAELYRQAQAYAAAIA